MHFKMKVVLLLVVFIQGTVAEAEQSDAKYLYIAVGVLVLLLFIALAVIITMCCKQKRDKPSSNQRLPSNGQVLSEPGNDETIEVIHLSQTSLVSIHGQRASKDVPDHDILTADGVLLPDSSDAGRKSLVPTVASSASLSIAPELPDQMSAPSSPEPTAVPQFPDTSALKSNPIPVKAFRDHFNEVMANSETLSDMFNSFPKEGVVACEASRRKNNIRKNRYKNIIPYDYNRVTLALLDDQPDSDYINASLIAGYGDANNSYIAAQGPKEETVNDFWRMIALCEVTCMIMLTSCTENAKKLCLQYWPDSVGSRKLYDKTLVKYEAEQATAHYVIRIFGVQYKGKRLTVRQYQMTSWRDKTKPDSPMPMSDLMRRVRCQRSQDTGPLLVHCSAGVGRTGTYIALDYLLDQAAAESVIDLDNIMHKLRLARPWMVQTVTQYMFIHVFLANILSKGDTAIALTQFISHMSSLRSTIDWNFQYLAKLRTDFIGHQGVGSEANSSKNRHQDIVADDRNRPYIMLPHEDGNDYINAVYVNTFWTLNSVLVTQVPLDNTVVDFWRLVHDHNVRTIVVLTGEARMKQHDCPVYWPARDQETLTFGPLIVSVASTEVLLDGALLACYLTLRQQKHSEEDAVSVTLYQYEGWADDTDTPTDSRKFSQLVSISEQHFMDTEYKTIVQCLNGVTRSGFLLAASHAISQSHIWNDVDVTLTALSLMERRIQFITSNEQFAFIHRLVHESLTHNVQKSAVPRSGSEGDEPMYANITMEPCLGVSDNTHDTEC